MKKSLFGTLAVMAVLSAMLSCGHGQQNAQKRTVVDSLLNAADKAGDYERKLALCDSLEQTGDISVIVAATYRGYAYQYLGKHKLEENEFKKALAETPKDHRDSLVYYGCATYMTDILYSKGRYEEALQLAIPTFENLKKMYSENPQDIILDRLHVLAQRMGSIQYKQGMKEEADRMYEACYDYARRKPLDYPSTYQNLAVLLDGIVSDYLIAKDYGSAEKWLVRQDSVVAMIAEGRGLTPKDSDEMIGRNYMNHVYLAQGLDRPEEFSHAMAAFRKTQYAKNPAGRLDVGHLLLEGKRYAEAADEYAVLDQVIAEYALEFSLENLSVYGEKFEANYKAGRRDSALAVAAYIVENLDSAIAKEKNSATAELATVYQTQQKDAEIAQQQISLSRQRLWGAIIGFGLITLFFIIYTLHRRRAAKRLADMKAAQERIESELRIARDIQMSMVPNNFPQYEGLDMYAEMNAAKEVGGDLYGYVLQGSKLHFCLGDVSGKGVPASLFMSQSARLFRTLATEGMTPVDIAVRMNNELAENNERGMFVTMFIGMLHLDTGRLDYCNCGHNPPVLDGQFMTFEHDNAPLGLWEDDPFYGESIDNIRGHQLLVYTDGLNEAENAQQELLGNKRLLELMADAATLDSHQVIDMLKEAVEQHRAGAEPNDDLTLMCLKLR